MHIIPKILLRILAIYFVWLGISTPFRIDNPFQLDIVCAIMLVGMSFLIWLETIEWELNPYGRGLRRKNKIKNNIPYEDIDQEMITLIQLLNHPNVGLKTKFCCYGHEEINDDNIKYPSVIFDETVTDKQIIKFAKKVMMDDLCGIQINLHKCVRASTYKSVLYINWKLDFAHWITKKQDKEVFMLSLINKIKTVYDID